MRQIIEKKVHTTPQKALKIQLNFMENLFRNPSNFTRLSTYFFLGHLLCHIQLQAFGEISSSGGLDFTSAGALYFIVFGLLWAWFAGERSALFNFRMLVFLSTAFFYWHRILLELIPQFNYQYLGGDQVFVIFSTVLALGFTLWATLGRPLGMLIQDIVFHLKMAHTAVSLANKIEIVEIQIFNIEIQLQNEYESKHFEKLQIEREKLEFDLEKMEMEKQSETLITRLKLYFQVRKVSRLMKKEEQEAQKAKIKAFFMVTQETVPITSNEDPSEELKQLEENEELGELLELNFVETA